jgi:predicted TIM-barrel fold metal-dependent hydrolase
MIRRAEPVQLDKAMSHRSSPPRLPPGACDCHTHVFLDAHEFPFLPARHYTPPPASIEALETLHLSLGIPRVVIVQPSVYGLDNRATMRALQVIGLRRARGVAVIDADATNAELDALATAGVRGVRVNLIFGGDDRVAQASAQLRRTAERIAPWGWHVQVFAGLSLLAACSDMLRTLPVPVVLDHYAGAHASRGPNQDGLAIVLALVESGRAYVKLSAPYRCSTAAPYADLAPLTRLFVQANPDRVLWGSDWPHPQPGAAPTADDISAPFDIDNVAVLHSLHEAIGNTAALRKLFTDNPKQLYGFED